jgi:Hsp70 protein
VETIGDWPHRIPYHRSIEKVPSDIAYDAAGRTHCGFDIPVGLKRLQWVKLLLETDLDPDNERLRKAVQVQSTLQALKELEKTPVQVAGDYLKWLWTNVTEKICDSEGDPDLVKNAAVTVIMTVPAMWSDKARDNTVRAAEIAGISADGRKLKFLNEPEAAAISELKKRISTGQIDEEDCVIICDAGGGTVDLVSYQVKQREPLILDQKVIAQGDLCGSVFIEHEFQRQVSGLLQGDMAKLSPQVVAEMAQRFEYVIKPSYDESAAAEHYIAVPGLEDNEERQIKNGSLKINS